MDPSNLPSKEHVEVTEGVLQWMLYIGGLVGGGWLLRTFVDKQVKKLAAATKVDVLTSVNAKLAPMQAVLTSLETIPKEVVSLRELIEDQGDTHRAEFITKAELKDIQNACVLHIWDKLMLDLEKRDRARDQQIYEKISSICQALSGVQGELKRMNEERRLDGGK